MLLYGLTTGKITLFFDYVDPASYLVASVLDQSGLADHLDWRGYEVRVPPKPMIDPDSPDWRQYQDQVSAYAEALAISMRPPTLIPWTRKAHELAAHARENDCYSAVRRALFQAHFIDGIDIGRIDFLVDIAEAQGLDRSGAKAALDVDHHTDSVLSNRALGEEVHIGGVPALVRGEARLEGLHSPEELRHWIKNHI